MGEGRKIFFSSSAESYLTPEKNLSNMAIAPVEAAQVMERKTSSPLCFDDLGYSRTTLLMEYSCRTKTMMVSCFVMKIY